MGHAVSCPCGFNPFQLVCPGQIGSLLCIYSISKMTGIQPKIKNGRIFTKLHNHNNMQWIAGPLSPVLQLLVQARRILSCNDEGPCAGKPDGYNQWLIFNQTVAYGVLRRDKV